MPQGTRNPATENVIAATRARLPEIRKFMQGHPEKTLSKVAGRFNLPVAAIEHVLAEGTDSGPAGAGPRTTDPASGSSSPPTATAPAGPPQENRNTPTPPAAGNAPSQGQAGGAGTPASTPPGGFAGMFSGRGTGDTPGVQATPSIFAGDVSAAPGSPGMQGPMTLPDVYQQLTKILNGTGFPADKVNGIVWAYQWEEPDNLEKLGWLMQKAGMNSQLREFVLNAWEKIVAPQELVASRTSGKDFVRQMRKEYGLDSKEGGPPDTAEMMKEELEREKAALEVEELRAAMDERRENARRRREELNSPPANPEDFIPVVLNFGGMPVERRIHKDQLPMWAPWIAKPRDADAPPPTAAKSPEVIAMEEENKRLKEEAAEKRRQEEADARDRRMMEFMKSIVPQAPAGPHPAELELQRQREQWAHEKEQERDHQMEAMRQRQHELEMQNRQFQQPGYWDSVRRDEEQRRRGEGWVPRAEGERITHEAIENEKDRELSRTQVKTTNELVGVAVDKVKGNGPMGRLVGKIADKVGDSKTIEKALDRAAEGGEAAVPGGANALAPSDSALLEAAQRAGAIPQGQTVQATTTTAPPQ